MNKKQEELQVIAVFLVVVYLLFLCYVVNSLNTLHNIENKPFIEKIPIPKVPDFPICVHSKLRVNPVGIPLKTNEDTFSKSVYFDRLKALPSMNMLLVMDRALRHQRHWNTVFPKGKFYSFVKTLPSWKPARCFVGNHTSTDDLENALRCFQIAMSLHIVEDSSHAMYESRLATFNTLFQHLIPGKHISSIYRATFYTHCCR